MSRLMANHRYRRLRGGLRWAALLCLPLLWHATAQAQPAEPNDPLVDQSFSIRQDENLYQLEEAAAMISTSLHKISDKVSILGINSLHFGGEFNPDFRHKAEVILLEKIFEANSTVKLAMCHECRKLETKIVRGVLKLRKGIPSHEARLDLAKKLGVQGFIDLGIFKDENQITVYMKVTEAISGAIILVDEIAGRRAPKRQSMTISFGETNFTLEIAGASATYNALVLGFNETVQMTGRLSFGVDLNIYTDNNKNNPDAATTLSAGIMLGPYMGFDILQMQASTSRLVLYLGLGKLLSPQLNYANFGKAGFIFVAGDRLVIQLGYNSIVATDIENGDKITGGGMELLFGYRF